ncbi:MAG: trypsin-like serine protease [Pirellulales bacterium]
MSLFHSPKLQDFTDRFERLRDRLTRKSRAPLGRRAYRRLNVDPLEQRTMLSVTPFDPQDVLVNQLTAGDVTQLTTGTKSIAVDHDGDFAVAWSRYTQLVDPFTGTPMVDPVFGMPITASAIWARYFTDEVQKVTLPANAKGGTFTLKFGGDEIQYLTVTGNEPAPFQMMATTIAGTITLGFDANNDGTVDASETTAPITYSEADLPDVTALAIQTELRNLGGPLADVTVEGRKPTEFAIYFGPAAAGQDQPQIAVQAVALTGGFYPYVTMSTLREPLTTEPIQLVNPNNPDPSVTALAIERAVQAIPLKRIPQVPLVQPAMAATVTDVPQVEVSVRARSATEFDITFVKSSGKKDQPLIVGDGTLLTDANGAALTTPTITVTTLKEPTPEFRVNTDVLDPVTGLPAQVNHTLPSIAMDADGEFVITWQSEVPDWQTFGSVSDIYARRYSSLGQPLGGQFQVNQFTANPQVTPSVAMDDNGNFVIVWANVGQPIGFFNGVMAQRFDNNGDRVGGEWLVNTEDTWIHDAPNVGMSPDGHFAISWDRSPGAGYTVNAEIYDPNGAVRVPQFAVSGGGYSSITFDTANHFVIAWQVLADTDELGATSLGTYAQRYDIDGNILQPMFRVNSASFPPLGITTWGYTQMNVQPQMDADGDLTITYDGFGPDVSNIITDVVPTVGPVMGADPDQATDLALLDAIDAGATPDQLAVMRNDIENQLRTLRGEANGVMYSQFDAAIAPPFTNTNILASDTVVNSHRDGRNTHYFIGFGDPQTDVGSGTFVLTVNGVNTAPIDWANLAFNMENELQKICGAMWPETNGPGSAEYSSIDVRFVPNNEVLTRVGTPFEIPFEARYNYEITFQGSVHDLPNSIALGPPGTMLLLQPPLADGSTPPAIPPFIEMETAALGGTIQSYGSIGMEPDGDYTVVWSEYYGTPLDTDIYVRRYDESTDTAGPLVTEFALPGGHRIADAAQVNAALQYMVVTLDEDMMTTGPSSVTNPANWQLMRDGLLVTGGVSNVEYGLNRASELGLGPVTNKYEAIVKFDSNGLSPGTPTLIGGSYRLVALNSLRDKAGNPLGRTGFQINGASFSRRFDVTVPAGGESRVNTTTVGDQNTQAESPQSVASDADGDYIVVYTGADAAGNGLGVFAKMYNADGTPYKNPDTGALVGEMWITSDPTATYASVARDADGDFIVTWSSYNATTSWDVYARRYDAVGRAKGVEFLVNSETANIQRFSTVALDNDGDSIITWQSYDQDGSGYGVYAQRYNPAGKALGLTSEAQLLTFVNSPNRGTFRLTYNGNLTAPITFAGTTFATTANIVAALAPYATVRADALNQTEIVITFIGADAGTDKPLMSVAENLLVGQPGAGLSVSPMIDGAPGEFQVANTTDNNQIRPVVAMDAAGDFVITWTSYGQNGDGPYEANVFAKRFVRNDLVTSSATQTASQPMITYPEPAWVADSDYGWIKPYIITVDPPANHIVQPGSGLDGVGAIYVNTAMGQAQGSGSLLWTGMHVLTAAHVVADNNGALYDPNPIVRFDLPTGPVFMQGSAVYVHPNYVPFAGNDIAIIQLDQPAPAAVNRYGINRLPNEVGQKFFKVGYGLIGTGTTGGVIATGGTVKLAGYNRYDAPTDILNGSALGALYGVQMIPGTQLAFDFDNGLTANDAFGVYFGINDTGLTPITDEVATAPGDSGGPAFLNGLIAGVTSWGGVAPQTDILPGLNQSFGEIASDTRVSDYADWIDSICSGGGPEFQVNQQIANNQRFSTIAMDADGDFVITWQSYSQDGGGNGYGTGMNGKEGVIARRYNADGSVASAEFVVNTMLEGDQQYPRATMDADGDFSIAWESFQDRPEPPYDDPLAPPDQASSYGIFLQEFVRNQLVGSGPFYGPNGQIGGEFEVNATISGDQRFAGMTSDHEGNYVVVWSGAGNQTANVDTQGVFMQRYTVPKDVAGPTVTDMLNAATPSSLVQIFPSVTFETTVDRFVVTFGEDISVKGGTTGFNSVTNPANWRLTRDGATLFNGAASIEYGLNKAYELGLGPRTGKHEAVLTFDGDPIMAGIQPLGQGRYVLTIRETIEDLAGNALDGNYDGAPGSDYNFAFNILIGGQDVGPGGPGDPGTPGTPTTPDAPANTTTPGDQQDPAVAMEADGDYIVVWTSFGQAGDLPTDGNIIGQRYDRFGKPIGLEFVVNGVALGHQGNADVAVDDFGNFVITWSGVGPGDTTGIFAQRFDAAGLRQGTSFLVNNYTTHIQDHPAIAMDSNGDFAITWTSYGQDGDRDGIYARRYDFLGAPLGNEFLVNSTTAGRQESSDIAMDDQGDFAITWMSYGQDGSSWGVYGQRYKDDGSRQGGEFRVNTATGERQRDPAVAMDSDGDFVVTWTSFGQDGSGYGIYAQRFNAAGGAAGGEFRVNTTTANWQRQPDVGMDAAGNFYIAWTAYGQDGDLDGIFARLYKADGSDFVGGVITTPLGEFQVNATTLGNQVAPAIALDADGDFVVAWTGPDLAGLGVYSRGMWVNSNAGNPAPAPAAASSPDATSSVATVGASGIAGPLDLFDALALESNYGQTSDGMPLRGDLDGDGDVDIFDVAILQTRYGELPTESKPLAAPAATEPKDPDAGAVWAEAVDHWVESPDSTDLYDLDTLTVDVADSLLAR